MAWKLLGYKDTVWLPMQVLGSGGNASSTILVGPLGRISLWTLTCRRRISLWARIWALWTCREGNSPSLFGHRRHLPPHHLHPVATFLGHALSFFLAVVPGPPSPLPPLPVPPLPRVHRLPRLCVCHARVSGQRGEQSENNVIF